MRKTDTKQRIMETATTLFSCHGFCATSIDDILKGVGITKGAFYHYFKGKDHLCETILDRAVAEYHQLADTLGESEDDTNPLHQWCQMLIEKQTSGQWLYYRLLTRLSMESAQLNASMQNKLRTFWLWCRAFYETLIRKTASVKVNSRGITPQELACVYMATQFGATWLARCAPDSQNLIDVCETMLKLTTR